MSILPVGKQRTEDVAALFRAAFRQGAQRFQIQPVARRPEQAAPDQRSFPSGGFHDAIIAMSTWRVKWRNPPNAWLVCRWGTPFYITIHPSLRTLRTLLRTLSGQMLGGGALEQTNDFAAPERLSIQPIPNVHRQQPVVPPASTTVFRLTVG